MDEKKYLKRKEKAASEGNRDLLAQTCNHLGDFYNLQGRYQLAVKEYEEEANLYSKMDKKLEMAKAHRMVGENFLFLSDFDNAKDHINIYLKIVKKLQNKVEEQRAFATLGRSHLLHGQALSETSASDAMNQLRQAEKAFLKSLLITKELTGQISKLEQLDMQARCYLNIGVVKEHMEDFEESIAYIEKAIKISKTNDIFELTHMCYVSMSLLLHCKRNDSTSALRYCNLALDVAKRLSQKVKKICETLIIKSEILIKASDFASAKQILTKAYKKNTPDENDRTTIEKTLRIVVKICQILDDLVTTSSVDFVKRKHLYEKLGDCCCHLSNYTKALDYYRKMLECAQLNKESGKSLIPIYVSLYQTYKDNKQYDDALKYLWMEFDLNKDVPKEAFSTLCTIAEICELQKQSFWTIQDIYQKAKEQAVQAGDENKSKLEKIAYARLRKLHIKHNMNVLAEELAQEASSKGIDVNSLEDDSDTESENVNTENNTPDLASDVCLEELTDSDTSDLDETEKPRPHRATRGTRSLTIKRNNKGETQLHQACIAGNVELVRRLIDQGHAVNVRDHAGWLPLHEACNHGYRDIVELLLDRGGAVAINDKGGTSCDGITPLYDACSNGFFDVIEVLLERGADTTVKTDFGATCLNSLDKWRHSTTLTEGEQAQYEQVRRQLINTLTKVGICSSKITKPLTNANVESRRKDHRKRSEQRLLTDEESNNSEQEENVLPSSSSRLNRSVERHRNNSSASASAVYKNAIEQLKRPLHRCNSFEIEEETNSLSNKQKRAAYLDSEDVDEDSWLIDDIGPDKKKRRFHNTPTKHSRPPSSYHKSPSKDHHSHCNSTDSGNSTWQRDSLTPENDAFQILLDAATGTSSQQRQKQAKKLTLSRTSSINSNTSISNTSQRNKPKHQTSLIDSGFCRFRSESPQPSSEDSNEAMATINMHTTEPDSTTTSIQLLISPLKSSPMKLQTTSLCLSTTVSFKVKIEDEMLLVPIERKRLNDINIRWLAEEAARRYYNLVGLKPLLRLKTADGFAYEENDPVNVAIEQNMILATVLEWQISPLGQRYEEMCIQLHKDVNKDVMDVLQRAQISNSIQLTDFWLSPYQTEPVFKAVLHQANLRSLNLSNNFIQNEGCRQLAKAMPTLKHLKSLNISGNFITCDGLDVLLSGIVNLVGIEEIVLNQNPLGNNSIRLLDSFCNGAAGKSLQKLHLSHCSITQLYEYDLNYNELLDIDISFNQLTEESLRTLLSKLNSSRLQNLNLSYIKLEKTEERSKIACASSSSSMAERLVEFFESGTCEKFKCIVLAACQLNDVNIYKIALCLSRANDLEVINISDNCRVSSSSLYFILDKVSQLRKLVATNCIRLFDSDNLERLSQLQHIPNYISLTVSNDAAELPHKLSILWHSYWGDRDVNKDVMDVLQRAQISNSIQLTDFWLSPYQTEPVFKAVLHQANLRSLNLSNNFIQNEGCRQLAKAMPTLKHLKSLNISGNFITCDGLDVLLSGIVNLVGIEEIVLNQNPLGNNSIRLLDSFCNGAAGKSLQKLHLSHCSITQLYEYDLNYNELLDIDISFNQLTEESLRTLLSKLNSSRLQNLNLSYIKLEKTEERSKIACASSSSSMAERLVEFFESGTCEKFKCIVLAACQLNDVNIYKIALCLSRANDLEVINISDNCRVSSSSLYFILDKVSQLRKLVATNCIRLFDSDNLERLSQLQHIPNYISLTVSNDAAELPHKLSILWHSYWGDRGKIKTYDNNITLYINGKDLGAI